MGDLNSKGKKSTSKNLNSLMKKGTSGTSGHNHRPTLDSPKKFEDDR